MLSFVRNFVAVLAVAAAAVPWSPGPAAAIAHGADARDGSYGFSALLTMTGLPAEGGGTRDSSCSGALIAPRWVITAGHCFRDTRGRRVSRTVAERTTAVVGRTDLSKPGGHEAEVVAVRQADGTDVALAELREPVTAVTPLPLSGQPPVRGEVLRLTGFGLVDDGAGTRPATRLQTGQFTVDAVGDTLIETSGRAPRRDTSPCPHDSGGPYFRERAGTVALAAVVSSGPGCPHRGPDLSARTDNLRAWIDDTVASSPSPGTDDVLMVAGVAVASILTVAAAVWRRTGVRR